jgi:hypothetical protein
MRRTHVSYLVMLSVFGTGLWGILRAGAGLKAADSITGEWQLAWESASSGISPPDRITFEQYGRYLIASLRRGEQPVARLKGELRAESLELKSGDGRWTLTGTLDPACREIRGTANAPTPSTWVARPTPPNR